MKITHLVHACLLVGTGGARILIDPGTMSEGFDELRDLHAVLVTHTAMIHPDMERTTNIGFYFTDSGLLHPGDDLTPPAVDVNLLALPVSGPWLSLADAVDDLRAINPPTAFAMHEAALTHPDFWYDTIETLKPTSTTFQILKPGTPTEL